MAGVLVGRARRFPERTTVVSPDDCAARNPLGALMTCAHQSDTDSREHTCPFLISIRLGGDITVAQSVGDLAVRLLNADRAEMAVGIVCALARRSGRASSW